MKILLTLLSLLIVNVCLSQKQPYQTPYQQLGSVNIAVESKGGLFPKETLTVPVYSDTTSANLSRAKFYAGSLIFTLNDSALNVRSNSISKWIKIGGNGGSGGSGFNGVATNEDSTQYYFTIDGIVNDSVETMLKDVYGDWYIRPANIDGRTIQFTFNHAAMDSAIAAGGGGGGSSQTLQQVYTQGATLTQSNTINNGGYVQKNTNGKNQFDSIGIQPANYVADSIFFSGTSITYGVGASSVGNRYATLVSNAFTAPAVDGILAPSDTQTKPLLINVWASISFSSFCVAHGMATSVGMCQGFELGIN